MCSTAAKRRTVVPLLLQWPTRITIFSLLIFSIKHNVSWFDLCPVHLLGQNYFCPGQNENCPGQNHFCPGQKILSEAKKSFFIQFITNDELFIHVQNFLFRTKNILSETILILSRTKIILSGQMDWALDFVYHIIS